MTVDADALLHVLELQPPDSTADERLAGGAVETIGKALKAAAAAALTSGALGPESVASVVAANREVVGAVADALTLRLREILLSAWNKRAEIQAYADPAKHSPKETYYVKLYEHPITWTYAPTVKVTVPPYPSVPITLEVKLALKMDQAVLVIAAGKPTAIEPGKGKVEASATFGGLELCNPTSFDLGKLPGRLDL